MALQGVFNHFGTQNKPYLLYSMRDCSVLLTFEKVNILAAFVLNFF